MARRPSENHRRPPLSAASATAPRTPKSTASMRLLAGWKARRCELVGIATQTVPSGATVMAETSVTGSGYEARSSSLIVSS